MAQPKIIYPPLVNTIFKISFFSFPSRNKEAGEGLPGGPAPRGVRPPFFNANGQTRNPRRAPLAVMYRVQQEKLEEFRGKAEKGDWGAIHSDHFDWFMFPIEDGSRGQYNVFEADVEELKGDAEWRKGYLEGVDWAARAWGWDLQKARPISPLLPGMGWTCWDVRLAKMIRSLWIFREKKEMESLQRFALQVAPQGGLKFGSVNLDEVYFMDIDNNGKTGTKKDPWKFSK
eukprot:TRINITY_DN3407_c0_g1_i1.p1 TRINITY_DN3407_c0_g1~~TRINITY_DN3407_c0_g1_i1.p1  ORF type:complete len:256 (+),score=50.92 TRINITY_DN3407_c0_g1_i1:81-770(+)